MAKPWRRVSMQQKNGTATLNITSLMDVMTIILIFLLFSFSSQDQNLRLSKDMELPKSTSEKPFKWAINITLTENELMVEDLTVCRYKNGQFGDIRDDPDKIVLLYKQLTDLKSLEKYREVDRDASEPVVIFQADKKHKFDTIYRVMKTAAMAGYPNFRFAVLKH
jgi:biopolymer transport protein ExbD